MQFSSNVGFSSGAIAKGDFHLAIDILNELNVRAIELSTLREDEVESFFRQLQSFDLSGFDYISFHAPSKLISMSEQTLIKHLDKIAEMNWPIVLHPDVIEDYRNWKHFGALLLIENMDKRKAVGRTLEELDLIFNKLPESNMCFDIAHSSQIDPSMIETYKILTELVEKIAQFHVSTLSSNSKHVSLNFPSIYKYLRFGKYFKSNIPVIVESVVEKHQISQELFFASLLTEVGSDYFYSDSGIGSFYESLEKFRKFTN